MGGPDDPTTETGPLISAAHRDKVEAYVAERGRRGRGAALRRRAPEGPAPGRRLLLPADDARRAARQDMSVVHEESFGPVLTVETFTDLDEAVRSPTTPSTAWRGRCSRPTTARARRSRPACATARLDQRLRAVRARRPSGADRPLRLRARARAARASPSTRRPSTSGATPGRVRPGGSPLPAKGVVREHRRPERPTGVGQCRHRRVRLQAEPHAHPSASFHTFAAGISYISILTGTFQLFYFGLGTGGPAYWWSWPLVFVGQLMVALCFCELAARFPVAGLDLQLDQAPDQPARRLARPAG